MREEHSESDERPCSDIELYALGMLDGGERVRMETHVQDCAECKQELDRLQELLGLLPLAAEQVDPPEGMKKRVLNAVLRGPAPESRDSGAEGISLASSRTGENVPDELEQVDAVELRDAELRTAKPSDAELYSLEQRAEEHRDAEHAAELYAEERRAETEANRLQQSAAEAMNSPASLEANEPALQKDGEAVTATSATWTPSSQQQTRGWRASLTAVLAAAAAVMLLLSGVLAQRMDSLNRENKRLAAELGQTRLSLDNANSELKKAAQPFTGAAVSQVVSLKPVKDLVARGQAYILVDERGTHLIVQASKLPELKDEQAFQVWLIKGDKPVNAGTFKPSGNSGAVTFTFPGGSFDQVAITLEPDAFGATPRGEMVLAGALKA
ncbi:Putative zinc-finger [Paenibacillaceae bacterium GAS479]|nr:Putative zinc-finger [Paenibacillaceae bacterium GAS479]